jgi:hypothetical protein
LSPSVSRAPSGEDAVDRLAAIWEQHCKLAVKSADLADKHLTGPLSGREVLILERMRDMLVEQIALFRAVLAGEQPDTSALERVLRTPSWKPLAPAAAQPGRACEVCGESLDERRADATVCGAGCRRERSRVRALSAGRGDAGYQTLAEYANRRQRRAKRARAA